MIKGSLYDVAKRYIDIIDSMEKTHDKDRLTSLEELRVIWHNKFMEKLKQEGIAFKDREHVTRIAYRIIEKEI